MYLLPPPPWLHAQAFQTLCAAFAQKGEEIRVVGGALRSLLMPPPIAGTSAQGTEIPGKAFLDIDLATTARPERSLEILTGVGFKALPTALTHGTVTAYADNICYEITTLRKDIATDGRRAWVIFGQNWEEDALRRDFTVNALYADCRGLLHDFVGGISDCQQRIIRFIGDPAQRIEEDYLRILRYFRFQALFGRGVRPPEELLTIMAQKASNLAGLSASRKTQELYRFLSGVHAPKLLPVLQETGLWRFLVGQTQTTPRAAHTLAALYRRGLTDATARNPLLRLAAAADLTLETLPPLIETLQLSKREQKFLYDLLRALTQMHNDLPDADWQDLLRNYGPEIIHYGIVLAACQAPLSLQDSWSSLLARIKNLPCPIFPLSGHDFRAEGIPAGPPIGQALTAAEAYWRAHSFRPEKEELLQYALAQLRTAPPK